MRLLEPLTIGSRATSNRVMFGPHVTNLGADDRSLSDRHVAYYERRALGGCGLIVVEGASVHPSDWPYERAPLAANCGDGWRRIADACAPYGSTIVASLDHSGGQGSSAYNQAPLWAPSRVPEVNTREVPKWMEASDIDEVIAGFVASAEVAMHSGLAGVEINAGQHSLIRQFMSGLTNQRDDEWGHDKLLLARRVIESIRTSASFGSTSSQPGIVGLRLSCDELAPWAGITPDMAPAIAVDLASAGLDYLVVTRGSIYSMEKTRPDFHEAPGFNIDVCRSVRSALRDAGHDIAVFLQGSIVDWGQAEWSLGGFDDDALADGVEMTRAHIADPDVITKLARDAADEIRPCTRCNQTCQVRDARNPIVTCVGEPTSGRELEDPNWYEAADAPRRVLVVGAGPSGLETARVAVLRGHHVTLVDEDDEIGGIAAIAGPHGALIDWYRREHERLGTEIALGTTSWTFQQHEDPVIVQCTGSQAGFREYDVSDDAVPVVDIVDVRRSADVLPENGQIVLFDPIGGPIAVALAEELGDRAVLVTQDNIAGNELSRTGDLAPANTRLAQRAVTIERRSILRAVTSVGVELEDRFSGDRRVVECSMVVDCGFRVPTDPLDGAHQRVGDAVAPRTVLEAILEARRAAFSI